MPRRCAGVPLSRIMTVLACAVLSSGTLMAEAQDKADDKDKGRGARVEIEIRVIRATKTNEEIDPELKDIAEQLNKQFKFTGFKLEKRCREAVELAGTHTCELGHGFTGKVTPRKVDAKRVEMQVEITHQAKKEDKPASKMNVTVTVEPIGFLTGGWQIPASEDVLVLAISARPVR
jgi:hypothetical protein